VNKILKRISKGLTSDELTHFMGLINNDDLHRIFGKQYKKLYGTELSNKIRRLFYGK
jgi:hypothetical protein